MNGTALLIFFTLLFSTVVHAIDEPHIIRQTNLLIKQLQKKHVKPRAIDDAFGISVNQLVIDFLDPNKAIFTSEDLLEFNRLALAIDQDIEEKKLTYFSAVNKRFLERITALSTLTEAHLKTAIVLKSSLKIPSTEFYQHPATSAHGTHWKQLLQLQIMDRMLSKLEDDELQFPSDSIAPWEAAARKTVSEKYKTVFAEFKEDGTFLETIYLEAISMSFDPHSLYFTPSAKKDFEEELTPERELYGFSFTRNSSNQVVISDVYPGSPAWLSDELHEGDIIESVRLGDGELIDLSDGATTLAELSVVFDASKERKITLISLDETGKQRTIALTKQKVYSDNDVIKNAVLQGEKKIGYVTLPDFYVNWTDTSSLGCSNDLAKCIIKLKKENIDGLILDLRGNGGGSLREAVDLSGLFIDYGPIVAMTDQEGEVHVLKDFNRGSVYSGPLIVLIDEGSASASEVVAGVLQDYNKALIVGRQSFGKATSQQVFPLDPSYTDLSSTFMEENPDFGYANITTGILYRVTRDWNQRKGVTPDVPLNLTPESESQEREVDYENVLIPDSITKKMTFTPSSKLPIDLLKSSSVNRLNNVELFSTYNQLLNDYKQLEKTDEIVSFDLSTELASRNKWLSLYKQLDDYVDTMALNFEPKANVFDREIYAANPILQQYNVHFLERLTEDIELIETVNIMTDLINNWK